MRRLWLGFSLCAFVLAGQTSPGPQDSELAANAVGILQQRCLTCHGAAATSGLRLDSREAVLKGGDRGPAVVPGDAAKSLFIAAVRRTGELSMPPGPKLADAEIATLEKWVNAGAAWPSSTGAVKAPDWWSFKKPVQAAVPALSDPWVKTSIDAFILRKLNSEKLKPAAQADRATLIRRAYYDLTGLPPTAEQVEKFVKDPAPDAYSKLIDELLASPRYGEKWGQHWLDLVRYGDTSGFEQDPYNLYAWRYRDWVIDSFNKDKPYDQFVREQIAGDELYPDNPEAMSGTGYYAVGPNRDMLFKVEDVNRQEELIDYVDTTSSVFLGLTVGCARCHDHKFDPIPQRDYYRMRAIFTALEKTRVFLQYDPARSYDLSDNGRQVRLYEISDQLNALLGKYENQLRQQRRGGGDGGQAADGVQAGQRRGGRAGMDQVVAAMTPEDKKAFDGLQSQLLNMFRNYKPGPFSPGVHDISREAPLSILPGRSGRPAEAVPAGFLTALGGGDIPAPPLDAESTYRRAALAKWMANEENPLTARVIVNRIWQYHFGRGLVGTPSDLGHRGGEPSHPELLDWMAVQFMKDGWSIKKLHKTIMTSSVYMEGSEVSADATARDANNLFLSHFNQRRLTPEEIRDTMLQSSGALNLEMGGRPVVPPVAREELYGLSGSPASMWAVTADASQHTRRSIYMLVRRTWRPAMFESFDAPDNILSCPRRVESNTAPQSLTMLNGKWTTDEAKRLADAIAGAGSDNEMTSKAWLAVYSRAPTAEELATSQQFLERQTTELGSRTAAAAELIRALFNTNEFLYVD